MKFYSGYSWLHTNTFKNLSQKTPQTCQNPSENTGNQILLLWCYFVLSSHFCIRFWDLSCNSLNSFVLGLPLFLHLPPLPSKLFSSLYNHQGRPDTPATVTIKSSQSSQSPQSSIILVTIVIPVLACSRHSDSRAWEKNSQRKQKQGETRGGRRERTHFPPPPPLTTYRCALLSERLEQAIPVYLATLISFCCCSDLLLLGGMEELNFTKNYGCFVNLLSN